MPPRAKPQADGLTELASVLGEAIRKANADGGQRATATIESQEKAIEALTKALESREDHIRQYQHAVEVLLLRLGEQVTSNKDLALIAANKETTLAELQGKESFRTEMIRQFGPVAAGPVGLRVAGAILGKFGLPIDLNVPDPTKSDGTADGDKRAAAWATVEAIVTDPALSQPIINKVGRDQWEKTLDFFIALSQQQPPSAPTNGANVN